MQGTGVCLRAGFIRVVEPQDIDNVVYLIFDIQALHDAECVAGGRIGEDDARNRDPGEHLFQFEVRPEQ